jgi:ADP-heptose:LPS heptosyltransferase
VTRSNSAVRIAENAAMRLVLAAFSVSHAFMPWKRRKRPPDGPHRILIVKWCCMGDAVVSLYAIREFKRRNPGASIEMLVSKRIAEVYRGAPWIDAVHVLPVTGYRLARELADPRLWKRLLSLVFELRRKRFGQMVDLEVYRAHGALLKRLFGIPFSRGFRAGGTLDKGHDAQTPLPPLQPEWQCFYAVLGLEPPASAPEPLYARSPQAGRGVPRAGHGVPQAGRIVPQAGRIGMVFGSSLNWPQKKWPWEHFAALARLLHGQGHEIILFGATLERGESRRIREAAGVPVLDTTGSLDYAGLLEAVAGCDLVVGNDTGTLHLAAACGVPTVTLFGPTEPRKWNPVTSTPVYLEDVPCRPCYYLGSMPACTHFSCLRKLEPAKVAEAVRQRLIAEATSRPSPGPVALP